MQMDAHYNIMEHGNGGLESIHVWGLIRENGTEDHAVRCSRLDIHEATYRCLMT